MHTLPSITKGSSNPTFTHIQSAIVFRQVKVIFTSSGNRGITQLDIFLYFHQSFVGLFSFLVFTIRNCWLDFHFTLQDVFLGPSSVPLGRRHMDFSVDLSLDVLFEWISLDNDDTYSCFLIIYHSHDHCFYNEIWIQSLVQYYLLYLQKIIFLLSYATYSKSKVSIHGSS